MNIRDEIFNYAKENFGSEPEFLWQKYPDYAVLRSKKNKKWYALIASVPMEKLGFESSKNVDILKKTGFLSFAMSFLWIIDLLIMVFIIKNTYINYIIVLLFLFILFFGVGIALWTLSLLWLQATEYKEENDLTI